MKKTKLVRKWKPGDRRGELFFVASATDDSRLSRFCSGSEIVSIIREFLEPIPVLAEAEASISIGIELYAQNGGQKRIEIGRWQPSDHESLEQFAQACKRRASEYHVVYPPNESVENS
jgi:hypothetical protein